MRCFAPLLVVMALTGCETKPLYPVPTGTQVTYKELKELFNGAVVHGQLYETNNRYIQHYHSDGRYTYVRTESPNAQSYDFKAAGTWKVSGDKICRKVKYEPELSECLIVYKEKGQIEFFEPLTARPRSFSSKIEYKKEKLPPPAVVPPPPVAAVTVPKPLHPSIYLQLHSTGSGFIVNNQTIVLTNNHVIKGCIEVTVRIDNRDIKSDLKARDERNDLALLQLPAGKYPTVAFRGNDGLYPGDSVVAIGYPLSGLLASEGNVSVGIVSALAGWKNDTSHLQISAPIQPGNSGGPLFDSSGNVVGVIVSGLVMGSDDAPAQNVNFAIKSSVAISFMQANGVDFMTLNSAKEQRPADVARKGRPATVFVKCWK
ncbi:MAG: serine protease [Alphaproteobacteria bacterium]|nr:serine protease [Alphaproteobacteria bacterium]